MLNRSQFIYRLLLAFLILSVQLPFSNKAWAENIPSVQNQNSQEAGSPQKAQASETVKPVINDPAGQQSQDGKAKDAAGGQTLSTVPAGSTSASVTPLTPGQKFKFFAKSSFVPPTPYVMPVIGGIFTEGIDNDHHRRMTAGDYFADSMTRAARGFAFNTTANFFGQFAYASAFKQDPRYFRSNKRGFGRISYAVSRLFITQGDNGHRQFNASLFAGALTTAGIANVWSRREDRTLGDTMNRFGLYMGYSALINVLREWFGKR